jgi:hypothetical protein
VRPRAFANAFSLFRGNAHEWRKAHLNNGSARAYTNLWIESNVIINASAREGGRERESPYAHNLIDRKRPSGKVLECVLQPITYAFHRH